MSVIIRLQNLPWSANALDIRNYFQGLSIPEGGVHIVGGELGDAFIAFSTDEDARQAMLNNEGKIKEVQVKLLLSSRSEMHKVIEAARQTVPFMQLSQPVIAQPTILSQSLSSMLAQNMKQTPLGMPVLSGNIPQKLDSPKPYPEPVTIPDDKDKDLKRRGSKDRKSGRSRSKSRERDVKKDRGRDKRDRRDRSRSRDRSRDRRRRDRSNSRDRSRSLERRDRKRDRRDRSRSRDRTRDSDTRRSRDRRQDEKKFPGNQDNPPFSQNKNSGRWSQPYNNNINNQTPNIPPPQTQQPSFPIEPPAGMLNTFRPVDNTWQGPKRNIGGIPDVRPTNPVNSRFQQNPPINRFQQNKPNFQDNFQQNKPNFQDNFQQNKPSFQTNNFQQNKPNFPDNSVRNMNLNQNQPTVPSDSDSRIIGFSDIKPNYPKLIPDKPAFDISNQTERRQEDLCVQITNFPIAIAYSDVRKFFFGLNIASSGVKMINDNMGRRTGTMYIKFIKPEDKMSALQKSGQFLKGANCFVSHLDDDEFERAIDLFKPPFEPQEEVMDSPDDADSQKGLVICENTEKSEPVPEKKFTVLCVEDLPPFAKEHDIIKLFSEYSLLSIMIQPVKDTRKLLVAYVQFLKPDDAKAVCEKKSGYSIGHKILKVSPCYPEDYEKVKSQNGKPEIENKIEIPEEKPSSPEEPAVPESRDPRQKRMDIPKTDSLPFQTSGSFPNQNLNMPAPLMGNIQPFPWRPSLMDTNFGPGPDMNINMGIQFPNQLPSNMTQMSGNLNQMPSNLMQMGGNLMPGNLNQIPGNLNQMPGNLNQMLGNMDHISGNGMDENNKFIEPAVLDCVLIKGLPVRTTNRDILDFFSDVGIIPARIHIMLNTQGVPSGDCFCEFNLKTDAEKAAGKHGSMLGMNILSVELVTRIIVQEALGLPPKDAMMNPRIGSPFRGDSRDPRGMRGDHRIDPRMDRRGGMRGDLRGGMRIDNRMNMRGDLRGGMRDFRGGFRGNVQNNFHGMDDQDDPEDDGRGSQQMRGGFRGGRGTRGVFIPRGRGAPRGNIRGNFRGRGSFNNFRFQDQSPQDGTNIDDPETFGEPGCVVALENIPFRCGTEDILEFFGDYDLSQDDIIRRFNERGMSTGDARVSFRSPFEAAQALQKMNKRLLQGRTVTMHLV